VEAVPTISRIVFSEVKSRTLHLVDPASPQVPVQLAAAGSAFQPSAFAVDRTTGSVSTL